MQMPCGHKINGRNLVICIDGAFNQFGQKVCIRDASSGSVLADILQLEKNTNVIEMYNIILKEAIHNQRTWYNSGIGAYAPPSWRSLELLRLYHSIDFAIAW